jgi:hypothetical protein
MASGAPALVPLSSMTRTSSSRPALAAPTSDSAIARTDAAKPSAPSK